METVKPTVDRSDFLTKILEAKSREVEAAKRQLSEKELRSQAEVRRERRPFEENLATPGPSGVNIIAEIKRASPSRGAIRTDLKVEDYAGAYTRGGAAAISVLTDQHFQGVPEDLRRVRAATDLPLLRKDFIISTYQIYEAVVLGADAVLLIVRALSPEFLRTCLELCRELKLGALVEVHDASELEVAMRTGARIIGINNRDLRTFQTDLATSERLSRYLEPGQVAVAESGIHARTDIERLQAAGIWNFLIGESLVRAASPEGFLKTLQGL